MIVAFRDSRYKYKQSTSQEFGQARARHESKVDGGHRFGSVLNSWSSTTSGVGAECGSDIEWGSDVEWESEVEGEFDADAGCTQ